VILVTDIAEIFSVPRDLHASRIRRENAEVQWPAIRICIPMLLVVRGGEGEM
jgi:hypothetical protein